MVFPRRQERSPSRQGLKQGLKMLILGMTAGVVIGYFWLWIEGDGSAESTLLDHFGGVDSNSLPTKELDRYACSEETAQKQEDRIDLRFNEWWSHSACPDQVWMDDIPRWIKAIPRSEEEPFVVLDIGCNKGYTSADFMDLFRPADGMNPKTLHDAIKAVAKEDKTEYDRTCGVCGDCNRPLNSDSGKRQPVEVHCFEPSPATYNMLTRVKEKLHVGDAHWHIHNKGLHEKSGILAWHMACKNAVGDELCTIVPEDTPESIQVEVVTVDGFLKSQKPKKLIHMLKIDAEGLDPAVLRGAEATLQSHKAVMVMFEFNPGLRDKKPPYGMWGDGGTTTLLEVTDWLDGLSYDCYLDSRVNGPGGVKAPPLYRITGGCLRKEPKVRGWANVVCASRAFPEVAKTLRDLAPLNDEL